MHPHLLPNDVGWMEVIAGCMYSGKTEELIRRVRRAQYARQPVIVFSPSIDRRYSQDCVDSHSGHSIMSVKVAKAADIPRPSSSTTSWCRWPTTWPRAASG
jgi:thymidine kinase